MQNLVADFKSTLSSNRIVALTVFAYSVLALGHIPLEVLNTLFDKNQSVQFLATMAIAAVFGVVAIRKRDELVIPRYLLGIILVLLLSLILSAVRSQNFFASLTGDSMRYAGIASTCALMIVALFHGFFTQEVFIKVAKGYLCVIAITEVLAVLQFFKVITLPGLQGNPTSTFGNLDYYSAYIGTSFPLLAFVFLKSGSLGKKLVVALGVLSLICLRLTDAKQGYVDVLIVATASILYVTFIKFRREQDPDRERYSLGVRTTIYTFLLFVWLEIIFVIPFIGKSIPFVGDDPQVAIRGVLWMAGINQFNSEQLLGVGPDQYGSYYEKFRTVNSTIVLPSDSSNDAHSSTVQTLATTGIVGTLLFLLLIASVIRALLIIAERDTSRKHTLFALALYLFVYLTNSAISPIVLPHKYLFWAVCGYLIFEARRLDGISTLNVVSKKISVVVISAFTAIALFVGSGFLVGQINFARWGEANKANSSAVINVKISPFIPCTVYFSRLVSFIAPSGNDALEKLSRDQIKLNPRCVEAQTILAKIAYNKADYKEMRKRVYILIDLVPARREILDIATLYAFKANDEEMKVIVSKQLARMGVREIQIG